tara:strand:- start:2551 stop:2778 length:228 start_codon:yes stop_codon:yes gene_type:complete
MAISRPNIGQQLINKGNNMGEGDKLVSQGYNARKDESIAMRVKKKRTAKQLKASRDDSYGVSGHGTGTGKINKTT